MSYLKYSKEIENLISTLEKNSAELRTVTKRFERELGETKSLRLKNERRGKMLMELYESDYIPTDKLIASIFEELAPERMAKELLKCE